MLQEHTNDEQGATLHYVPAVKYRSNDSVWVKFTQV